MTPNVGSVALRSTIFESLSGTLIPDATFERLRSLSIMAWSPFGHALSDFGLFTIAPRTFFDKQTSLVELQVFSKGILDPNRVTPPSTLKALNAFGTSVGPHDPYRGGSFISLVVLRIQIRASRPHDTWEHFIRELPNLKCLEISRELFHPVIPFISESVGNDNLKTCKKISSSIAGTLNFHSHQMLMKAKYLCLLNDLWVIDYDDMVL